MKKYVKSNITDYGRDYNVSWWTQNGDQVGEYVTVPAGEDPYRFIDRYLADKYGDDYGDIADYIEYDPDGLSEGDFWDDYHPIEGASEIKRYSDVRPHEDRKYWYFTTHGIGPGTIPKDLTVLETREGKNDRGTYGTFILLDGVLNTDELEYYDLRELSPNNVMSAEEIDDDDEWSPFRNGTYRVDGKNTKWTNNPITAIKYWFQMQKNAWTDVMISCKTRDEAVRLVKAATPELLEKLNDHFEQPYKIEYLIEESKKQVANGCKYFHEDKYGYGDSVHPFGVG